MPSPPKPPPRKPAGGDPPKPPGKKGPPPPPPAGANRRQHERVEVVASVEIASAQGELFVLTATNISVGGLFLEGDPAEYPDLVRGAAIEVHLSIASTDVGDESSSGAPPPPQQLRAKGKVIRIQPPGMAQPPGFGVILTDIGTTELHRLRQIIARAKR